MLDESLGESGDWESRYYKPAIEGHPIDPIVAHYIENNPSFDRQNDLEFITDQFPQFSDDKLNYLIYGGVSMKLLHPNRMEPHDIDILVRAEDKLDIVKKFGGTSTRRFDCKNSIQWRKIFRLPHDNQLVEDFLFENTQTVNFLGKQITTFSSPLLALSKYPKAWPFLSIEKNLNDISLLKVSNTEIEHLLKELLKLSFMSSQEAQSIYQKRGYCYKWDRWMEDFGLI